MSRQLAILLRHWAPLCGLAMTNDAWVERGSFMDACGRFTGVQAWWEDVASVVERSHHMDGILRLEVGENRSVKCIRGLRNHSISGVFVVADAERRPGGRKEDGLAGLAAIHQSENTCQNCVDPGQLRWPALRQSR